MDSCRVELDELDKVVAAIQSREQAALLDRPHVVGVGVGRKQVAGRDTGEPCLTVLVTRKLPATELAPGSEIPRQVEQCRTDVVECGAVTPACGGAPDDVPEAAALRARRRPALAGYSVSGAAGSRGTIAAAVIDRSPSPGLPTNYYVLGSNYALAALNDGHPGDAVLQPSASDGGEDPRDRLGILERFVPVRFDGAENLVDAALARVPFGTADRHVFWLGAPGPPVARVRIGQVLHKTGAGSCYASTTVRAVNVTLKVAYGVRCAVFVRQVVVSGFTSEGDSGALVVDTDLHPVGMVLGGSPLLSVVTPIGLVERELKIQLGL